MKEIIKKVDDKVEKVVMVVESLPNVKKEKEKFAWIDKVLRWGNRAFLAVWIFKRKGL